MLNTVMQPGPELDVEVARVMGIKLSYIPDYSTRIEPAMEAWGWLEKNNPWKYGGDSAEIYLMNNRVYVNCGGGSIDRDYFINGPKDGQGFYIQGETYPHAIALAVMEAGRESRGIVSS